MSQEELRFIKHGAKQWVHIQAIEGGKILAFRALSALELVSAVLTHSHIQINFSDTDQATMVIPVEPIQYTITLDAKKLVSVDSLERFSIWDAVWRTVSCLRNSDLRPSIRERHCDISGRPISCGGSKFGP
jgi:hypothetical protein